MRVPGTVFIEINKNVGFRTITRGRIKGAINTGKLVPLVGTRIGSGIDAASMRAVAQFASSEFPTVVL